MNEDTTIEIPKTKVPDVIDAESLDSSIPDVELATGDSLPTSDEILGNITTQSNALQGRLANLGTQESEQNLINLLKEEATAGDVFAKAEEDLGLPEKRQELGRLSSQIAAESNFLQADLLATERQASQQGAKVTTSFLARKMGNRQRESAIRSNILLGRANLLEGDIASAEASVARAVDLKFAPIRAKIDIEKFNLERLDKQRESLSKDQNMLLDRQLSLVKDREQTIRQEKQTIQGLASELMKSGASQDIIDQVLQSENPEEAFKVEGLSNVLGLEQKLRIQKLRTDLETSHLQNEDLKRKIQEASSPGNPLQLTGKEDFKAAGFAKRMHDSYKVIKNLTSQGVVVRPKRVAKASLFGLTNKQKTLVSAYRDFIAAKLREESGAAIPAEEYLSEGKNLVIRRQDNDESFAVKVSSMENAIESFIGESKGGFEYLVNKEILDSTSSNLQAGLRDFYTQATENNFSREEITDYIISQYPAKEEQIQEAFNAGFTLEEIINTIE